MKVTLKVIEKIREEIARFEKSLFECEKKIYEEIKREERYRGAKLSFEVRCLKDISGTKASASANRASMDLTRTLAKMRKGTLA